MSDMAEIAVIGGTGMYEPGMLEGGREINVPTPYGETSDAIILGTFCGHEVAFMPRHGRRHSIPPHLINYRANIWAFQSLGVKRIISPSAVGSLKEEMAPRDFVIPSQFLDFTKSRKGTFSEVGRAIHISAADPFCPQLQEVAHGAAKGASLRVHRDATYVCIEGPRFSTRSESKFFRSTGADVIGMTLVPECQLAREAQMCYASISTVTDYDVWANKPVTAKEVIDTLESNVRNIRTVIAAAITGMPAERTCKCGEALSDAELTA